MLFGRKALIVLVPIVALWLSTSACSCATAAERLTGVSARRALPPLATSAATVRAVEPAHSDPSSAQSPTLAPTADVPSESPEGIGPVTAPGGLLSVPTERNRPFVLQLTEERLNQELAGRVEQQQGVTVSGAHISIMADRVAVSLQATHQELGLSTGITAYAVPNVVDGAAYVRITLVELDNSLAGVARAIAERAIAQAVKQYSTPQGIRIPADNVEIQAISLSPGKVVISGRTR